MTLAAELSKLGLDGLPSRARQMVLARVRAGGLRDHRFGSARAARLGLGAAVERSEQDQARALMRWVARAQPRVWEHYPATLDRYPVDNVRLGETQSVVSDPVADAKQVAFEKIIPGTGPSAEAQATFEALVADWEGFERILKEKGASPKTQAAANKLARLIARDLVEWREFRDAWKNGIPSTQIGGKLLAETARARRIRQELADAKFVEPGALKDIQAPSVDQATGAGKTAQSVEDWVQKQPMLNWLTSPNAGMKRILMVAGGVVAAALIGPPLVQAILARRASRHGED